MHPTRFTNLVDARARFGDAVDRLGPFLGRVDPLADDVVAAFERMPPGEGWARFEAGLRGGGGALTEGPPELRALFDAVESVPVWVDWGVIDRGGRALLRAGPLGGLVLGLKSLVTAYTSPAGNKPLVFSGRLTEQASRRLHETARFVRATILPGGMRPRAPGYQTTLRVRLIHARVRRMILATGRWDASRWGAPINQHDEAGTSLLFSLGVLAGLRQLGVEVGREEAQDYVSLWRWSGWLMGIDPELLPATEAEAVRLAGMIAATQGAPDDDSRALTRALLEAPLREAAPHQRAAARRAVHVSAALCRALVGPALADALDIPRSPWERAVPWAKRAVAAVDAARRALPWGDEAAVRAGARYWDRVVEAGPGGAAELTLPQALAHAA